MHYFSLTNLKGACISLVIGLVVYLVFIRPVLMKKENGTSEYVDLWPSWLDIEDRVYRPAINGLLAIGGKVAGLGSEMTLETYIYRPLIRALTLIGAAVFGVLGGLTDFIADLISRKILSARKKKAPTSVGNVITRTIGGMLDSMAEGLNHTVLRGHQIEHHALGTHLRRVGWLDGCRQPDEPHHELWSAALRLGTLRDTAVSDVLLSIQSRVVPS